MISDTLTSTGPAHRARSLAMPVLGLWVIFVLAHVQLFQTEPRGLGRVDNDYMMRLVQVRDLLDGQGWFDLVQHRLGPDGVLMHWSRLVDAPLAGLILLFRQVMEPASAEWAALVVWPLFLALLFLGAVAVAGRALGGHAAGLIAAVLGFGVMLQSARFRPGAIDHHNLQIVLVAAAIAFLLTRERASWRLGAAGLCAAVGLSVAVETAPQFAALAAAVAVLWAIEGREADRRTALYALGLGGGLLVLFFLTTPPANRIYPACDVNSVALVGPAVMGAVGLGGLALYRPAARNPRLAALAALGLLVTALAALMPGSCFRNPLDTLDPVLAERWITNVSEAKSAFAFVSERPWHHLGLFVAPLVALAICAAMAWRGHRPGAAITLGAMIALSYAATLYQIRGVLILAAVSVPALAAGVAWIYRRYQRTGALRHGLATVALFLLAVPAGWLLVPAAHISWLILSSGILWIDLRTEMPPYARPSARLAAERLPLDCHGPDVWTELAAQPPGLVSAHWNQGAAILRATHHSVLAAPYHRNQAGILAQMEIADAPPDRASAVLDHHGVDYVAICPHEKNYGRKATPGGLFERLIEDEAPDYLERISVPLAPIVVYRVRTAQ